MEFAQIIKTLWDRKLGLLVILVLAILVSITTMFKVSTTGLQTRSYQYGAAQQQIMIDSSRSSLIDLSQDGGPLASRAAVYAEFMRSNAVIQAIAKRLGVPASTIVAQGPFTTAGGTQNIPRPSEARANEIRGEAVQYRLVFDAQQDLPIVSIFAQAPSGEQALKLATATVTGLTDYVKTLELQSNVLPKDQTEIRSLGAPVGGTVYAGAKPLMAVLAFIAVLVFGCVLMLAGVSLARILRQLRAEEAHPHSVVSAESMPVRTPVRAAWDGHSAPDQAVPPAAPDEEDAEPGHRRRSIFRSAVG
jgi:hypothetical protein